LVASSLGIYSLDSYQGRKITEPNDVLKVKIASLSIGGATIVQTQQGLFDFENIVCVCLL